MKENIPDMFDYIKWRGDITFDQVPFGTIDALVLAQITYFNFNGLIDETYTPQASLGEMYNQIKTHADFKQRCDMGAVINPRTPELFEQAAASKRFSDIRVCGHLNILDEEKVEQFAAITFLIDKKYAAVSFRGTDDTLVGWQEDMNILLGEPIPSEYRAVDYLNTTVATLKRDICVIGHSKGGCMAVYGATYCNAKTKKSIDTIYNFDGPGFAKEFFQQPDFLQIKDRVKSFYPRFDVVGMVFDHPEDFHIVESDRVAVFQHDALSWGITGNDFIYADDFEDESKLLNASFNEWANSLSVEDRRRFANTFFDVVYASGAKTNREIEQNKVQASGKMLAAMRSLPAEDRKHVSNMIHLFISSGYKNLPIANIFKPLENLGNEIKNSAIVNKIGEIGESFEKALEKK